MAGTSFQGRDYQIPSKSKPWVDDHLLSSNKIPSQPDHLLSSNHQNSRSHPNPTQKLQDPFNGLLPSEHHHHHQTSLKSPSQVHQHPTDGDPSNIRHPSPPSPLLSPQSKQPPAPTLPLKPPPTRTPPSKNDQHLLKNLNQPSSPPSPPARTLPSNVDQPKQDEERDLQDVNDSQKNSASQNNGYPPLSRKQIGDNGGEDTLQSENGRRRHQRQQKQAYPTMVPPPPSGCHRKEQRPIQDMPQIDQNSVERHMDMPPKNPDPTSSHPPINNHGGNHVSETNNKLTSQPKGSQKWNTYHGFEHEQSQQPPRRTFLPKPDGYPEPRPPTPPPPRPKKGGLEKIRDCFYQVITCKCKCSP